MTNKKWSYTFIMKLIQLDFEYDSAMEMNTTLASKTSNHLISMAYTVSKITQLQLLHIYLNKHSFTKNFKQK